MPLFSECDHFCEKKRAKTLRALYVAKQIVFFMEKIVWVEHHTFECMIRHVSAWYKLTISRLELETMHCMVANVRIGSFLIGSTSKGDVRIRVILEFFPVIRLNLYICIKLYTTVVAHNYWQTSMNRRRFGWNLVAKLSGLLGKLQQFQGATLTTRPQKPRIPKAKKHRMCLAYWSWITELSFSAEAGIPSS